MVSWYHNIGTMALGINECEVPCFLAHFVDFLLQTWDQPLLQVALVLLLGNDI